MIHSVCLLLLCLMCCKSDATINCSDPHFQETLIGMKSFIDYQGYLYTNAFDFSTFADDFFSGFKVLGQLPLYINIFDSVMESSANKTSGVIEYVSLFRTMLSNVLKSNCLWLNNQGTAFSLRPVNCSDPGEVALLASYMGTYIQIQKMIDVISNANNLCNPIVPHVTVEEYLNTTLPADDLATKTKLKTLSDNYMNY